MTIETERARIEEMVEARMADLIADRSSQHPGRLIAIAAVVREQVEWEVARARAAEQPTLAGAARQQAVERRGRRRTDGGSASPSVRLSVRMDRGDLVALERRADLLGITPSALARNLIRYGMTSRAGHGIDGMVTDLEVLAARMRAVVS